MYSYTVLAAQTFAGAIFPSKWTKEVYDETLHTNYQVVCLDRQWQAFTRHLGLWPLHGLISEMTRVYLLHIPG